MTELPQHCLIARSQLPAIRAPPDCSTMRAIGRQNGYCQACFTGVYPTDLDVMHTKTGFEKAIA